MTYNRICILWNNVLEKISQIKKNFFGNYMFNSCRIWYMVLKFYKDANMWDHIWIVFSFPIVTEWTVLIIQLLL